MSMTEGRERETLVGGSSSSPTGGWKSMAEGGNRTYADYLNLHELLSLQGDDSQTNDELHFVIIHQSFELWFKLIVSELRSVRDILDQTHVPESEVPKAVHHMGRITETFRLMANQWRVMETLAPQDFLAFRDGLGTASGFESFQMRELEILMGLPDSDRVKEMDPLAHFRKLAEGSDRDKEILARLEEAVASTSLSEALSRWLSRTPIQGSMAGDEDDEAVVAEFVEEYLAGQAKLADEAMARLQEQGVQDMEAVQGRFDIAAQGARDYLTQDGVVNRSRAGLLFIESYRELPLLAWPRTLIDAIQLQKRHKWM